MGVTELIIIAIGLSMDAFAVAACIGIKVPEASFKNMLIVGLYFGIFQAAMPVIGYFLGTQFADKIVAVDHWIAFALLLIIGGKMVVESFKKQGCKDRKCSVEICTDRECPKKRKPEQASTDALKPAKMLPSAVATSIDALAVGVTFAFLEVDIIPAVSAIGAITLVLSMIGLKIGNKFGTKFKSKAELIGGIILILIGVKILLEHLLQ